MNIQRYIDFDNLRLSHGAHDNPEDGLCYNEAIAFLAGEPHSDHPKCVCPVLRYAGMAANDNFPDDQRQRLKELVVASLGTNDPSLLEKRMFMCADRAVRVFAPIGLRKAGREAGAVRLESLPEIVDRESAKVAAYAAAKAADAAYAADAAADAAYAAYVATHAAAYDEFIELMWDMIRLSYPDAKPVVRITEDLEPVYA